MQAFEILIDTPKRPFITADLIYSPMHIMCECLAPLEILTRVACKISGLFPNLLGEK